MYNDAVIGGVNIDNYSQRWPDDVRDASSPHAADVHPDAGIQMGIAAERYVEPIRCDECSVLCSEDDTHCPGCGCPLDPYDLDAAFLDPELEFSRAEDYDDEADDDDLLPYYM